MRVLVDVDTGDVVVQGMLSTMTPEEAIFAADALVRGAMIGGQVRQGATATTVLVTATGLLNP